MLYNWGEGMGRTGRKSGIPNTSNTFNNATSVDWPIHDPSSFRTALALLHSAPISRVFFSAGDTFLAPNSEVLGSMWMVSSTA
jgi:hypothetical protein